MFVLIDFCLFNFVLYLAYVKTTDIFYNITSDVLSYAYQLLFCITFPRKHSSILPACLVWKACILAVSNTRMTDRYMF